MSTAWAKGSTTRRGYGTQHQRTRKAWARHVATGTLHCTRCDELITPDQAWHLDHSDDRTTYLGPAHAHCNTSAGGKKAHATPDPQPRPRTRW